VLRFGLQRIVCDGTEAGCDCQLCCSCTSGSRYSRPMPLWSTSAYVHRTDGQSPCLWKKHHGKKKPLELQSFVSANVWYLGTTKLRNNLCVMLMPLEYPAPTFLSSWCELCIELGLVYSRYLPKSYLIHTSHYMHHVWCNETREGVQYAVETSVSRHGDHSTSGLRVLLFATNTNP
jgi:hypothetical protein